MSKNVVGHSKLIGGVNYVTILIIGGTKGSVLGAQASPSPDTKKFSKKKHKNPFNGFLIFHKELSSHFTERITTDVCIEEIRVLIGLSLKYLRRRVVFLLASWVFYSDNYFDIIVSSWDKKKQLLGLKLLGLKLLDCYQTYRSDPHFHIMEDALLVLRFRINLYITLIYMTYISIPVTKLDRLLLC